jgi:hypothetical protein
MRQCSKDITIGILMTNKLISPIYNKKDWGSEIIWTLTDHYMAKTIEIDPYKITDLLVYEKKEKSIIVVEGILSLALGKCCNEENLHYYDCPEGWSIYIDPGYMHRYGATDKSVRIIEISSPEIDEAIVIREV